MKKRYKKTGRGSTPPTIFKKQRSKIMIIHNPQFVKYQKEKGDSMGLEALLKNLSYMGVKCIMDDVDVQPEAKAFRLTVRYSSSGRDYCLTITGFNFKEIEKKLREEWEKINEWREING